MATAATDQQMQKFCDARIRVRAEQLRDLKLAMADDKSAIDDVYLRATSPNQWADARTDGPPHLLAAGDAANPNDVTNYNALADLFAKFCAGTFANVNEANSAAALITVLLRSCVRPPPLLPLLGV